MKTVSVIFLALTFAMLALAWLVAPFVFCSIGDFKSTDQMISEDCSRVPTTSELTDALTNYDKALSINPSMAQAYLGRSKVFHQLGRNNEALQDINKALSHDNRLANAYVERATQEFQANKFNESVNDCNEYMRLLGKSTDGIIPLERARVRRLRHRALDRLGKYREAITLYEREIPASPDKSELWLDEADMYRKTGDNAQVISCLSKSIGAAMDNYAGLQKKYGRKNFPDLTTFPAGSCSHLAYQCRAEAYIKDGNFEAAAHDYETVLKYRLAEAGANNFPQYTAKYKGLLKLLSEKQYQAAFSILSKTCPANYGDGV